MARSLAILSKEIQSTGPGTWCQARNLHILTPPEPADPPPGLAEALGVVPIYSGKIRFDHFLELRSEEEVRGVAPDFGRLKVRIAGDRVHLAGNAVTVLRAELV